MKNYIQYLTSRYDIELSPEELKLDIYDDRMLQFLASAQHSGRQVKVTEVMQTVPGISPGTAHRRLKQLKTKGYVALRQDEDDERAKFVTLTAQAEALFSRRGQILTLAHQITHQDAQKLKGAQTLDAQSPDVQGQ